MPEPQNIPQAQIVGTKNKSRRFFSLAWLVPLLAAVLTGYLIYQHFFNTGPNISISFQNGAGLRQGQSPLKYRGVVVGEVRGISLSKDQSTVVVKLRLERSAAGLAREGSVFWVVRPQIEMGTIRGLETLVSGSYIEVEPGTGKSKTDFVGAKGSPVAPEDRGREIILVASNLGSLKKGSPVYYRGIEVGAVQSFELAQDSRSVRTTALIRERYAPLVHPDSRFWNVSGIDVDFGLFKGAQINVESLRSLMSGGVSFATPPSRLSNSGGDQANDQPMVFDLYEKPKDDWLKWAPAIELPDRPEKLTTK